jgi:hypothetical protein
VIRFSIPLRTKTGLNGREHPMVRAKRVEKEREATRAAWMALTTILQRMQHSPDHGALQVRLTRIGPRRIDGDNAVGALKAVRDELAAILGVDDGDRAIRWRYPNLDPETNAIGPYAVVVEIEHADGVCPACGRAIA